MSPAKPEDQPFSFRVKVGNAAQIGVLLTCISMAGGSALFAYNWNRDHKSEVEQHEKEIRAEAQDHAKRDDLIAELAKSVNEHTEALKTLATSLADVRENVKQIDGKLDRIGQHQ